MTFKNLSLHQLLSFQFFIFVWLKSILHVGMLDCIIAADLKCSRHQRFMLYISMNHRFYFSFLKIWKVTQQKSEIPASSENFIPLNSDKIYVCQNEFLLLFLILDCKFFKTVSRSTYFSSVSIYVWNKWLSWSIVIFFILRKQWILKLMYLYIILNKIHWNDSFNFRKKLSDCNLSKKLTVIQQFFNRVDEFCIREYIVMKEYIWVIEKNCNAVMISNLEIRYLFTYFRIQLYDIVHYLHKLIQWFESEIKLPVKFKVIYQFFFENLYVIFTLDYTTTLQLFSITHKYSFMTI